MLPPMSSLQISLLKQNLKGFAKRKTGKNEQNRPVLVNLTSTGCRHKWGIHRWNKVFQRLQQTVASRCKSPAMQNKPQSSPHNISCWKKRVFGYFSTSSRRQTPADRCFSHLMRSRGCSLKKQKNLAQYLWRLYLSLSHLGSRDRVQYLDWIRTWNDTFHNCNYVIEKQLRDRPLGCGFKR